MKTTSLLLIAVLVLASEGLVAQDTGALTPEKAKRIHRRKQYSPYANRKYPTRPLFGDTHVHTGMSLDAGVWGLR